MAVKKLVKPPSGKGGIKPKGQSPAQAATPPKEPEKPFSFITVRIGKLPGQIIDVALNGGRTVADAVSGANYGSVSDYEIRVNSVVGNLRTELKESDTVLLIRKIAGN